MFILFARENACFSVAGKEKGVLYDSDKYEKCYKDEIKSNDHFFTVRFVQQSEERTNLR